MPSVSKKQQKMFQIALAVRKGDLDRKDVSGDVLDIVDGNMTNKQIEDFAKKSTSLKDYIKKEEE